eukprot:Pgem_evm1s8157
MIQKRKDKIDHLKQQIREFSFKIQHKSIEPVFVPCSCSKIFERGEKEEKFQHFFKCYNLRNLWGKCAKELSINDDFNEKNICFGKYP